MIINIFQEIFLKLSDSLDCIVGITDKNFRVVASNNTNEIGKELNNKIEFEKIESLGLYVGENFIYKIIGNKQIGHWCIYCYEVNEKFKNYINILSITINEAIKYYAAKYDKCTFIKDIITDNILSSDIMFRQREFKFEEDVLRVCIILRNQNGIDNSYIEIIKSMFCSNKEDYVIYINEKDLVIVKTVNKSVTDEDLKKLVLSIISTLSSECSVKFIASVGLIVEQIKDLSKSYKSAQVALEIRKVFNDNCSVAVYNQLGLARIIYQLPDSMCKKFLSEVFKKGPIDTINDELMFTINKFFENNLNVSETSRKLFVHRNTLVYRIEKIKKIIGLDLRNFEDSIIFKIAMMVDKYLKEKPIKY